MQVLFGNGFVLPRRFNSEVQQREGQALRATDAQMPRRAGSALVGLPQRAQRPLLPVPRGTR